MGNFGHIHGQTVLRDAIGLYTGGTDSYVEVTQVQMSTQKYHLSS